jgi:hypothetical protein
MLCWSEECFHKVHQQFVADAASHRTATIQDGLGAVVGSANICMDAVHHHEVH